MKKLILAILFLIFTPIVILNFVLVSTNLSSKSYLVFAESGSSNEDEHKEEEKEEHEEDEKDEEDDDHRTKTSTTFTQEYEEVVVYESKEVSKEEIVQQETRYINVIDSGYDLDSDKDGLVDAIDPDPLNHQKLYFTDSDGDNVADIYDEYPDEDDFNYIEFSDQNNNGINDLLEPKK